MIRTIAPVEQSGTVTRRPYRMCAKLVIDTTDPDISFDENGISNYWHEHQAFLASLPDPAARQAMLDQRIARTKELGRGRK